MKQSVRRLILAVVVLVAANTGGAWAEEPVRPDPTGEPLVANATGGPDDFGYTWDTSPGFNWVDATVGTDTGLRGEWPSRTGALDLGFDFRYYENTRRQVWVNQEGYLLLTESNVYFSTQTIPDGAPPNDIIAPYWSSGRMDADSRVYYARGGSAPNRYFVVEWYQVHDWYPENTYSFEVVLWESGDIVFQYHTMDVGAGGRYCAVVGIEDSRGTDGLAPLGFCPYVQSGSAIRFVRPAPSARVGLQPPHQGRFTRPAEVLRFDVPVANTGELGADTFDITVNSIWPAAVYLADGTTPIGDTDGDGVADTGPMAPSGTTTLTVDVETPTGASVGDSNWAVITATSSLDPTVSNMATLQTAVPASFVQAYEDSGPHLYLVQPAGHGVRPAGSGASAPAVIEAPDGDLVSVNPVGVVCGRDGVCTTWLEYSVHNRYGEAIELGGRLTDHSGAAMDTHDWSPAVAVAPNGNVGIVWVRTMEDSGGQANRNIYFAVLGGEGNTVLAPTKVTDNDAWGDTNDFNVPSYLDPQITATDDGRFMLAWHRYHQATPDGTCTANCYVHDVHYYVCSSDGSQVRPPAKLTNDEPGGSGGAYYPALASLTGGRVLLAFERDGNIVFAVLASDGTLVRASASLTNDQDANMLSPAAAQLSNGNIVVAWDSYSDGQIAYAVLGPDYGIAAGPFLLDNPASTAKDGLPSVAPAASGHAVLTWQDRSYQHLYYALIDGVGDVVTRPQIFYTATGPWITLADAGHANTSYSWQPAEGVDGRVTSSSGLAGTPGSEASVPVRYGSYGQTPLSGGTLTMDLPAGLTYVSDDSGLTPLVEAPGAAPGSVQAATGGTRITWDLPEMALFDVGSMTVQVGVVADAELGALYPVSLALTATDDANPEDNQAGTQVMAADLTYLPAAFRGW